MVDKIKKEIAKIVPGMQSSQGELSEEIKTALQVKIFGREQIDGTTFYVIRTWLVY